MPVASGIVLSGDAGVRRVISSFTGIFILRSCKQCNMPLSVVAMSAAVITPHHKCQKRYLGVRKPLLEVRVHEKS